MGWDRRGYFYMSVREGNRVRRTYIRREMAHLFEHGQMLTRRWRDSVREHEKLKWQMFTLEYEMVDDEIEEQGRLCRLVATAAMLLAGYHSPRRQWRKREDSQ